MAKQDKQYCRYLWHERDGMRRAIKVLETDLKKWKKSENFIHYAKELSIYKLKTEYWTMRQEAQKELCKMPKFEKL